MLVAIRRYTLEHDNTVNREKSGLTGDNAIACHDATNIDDQRVRPCVAFQSPRANGAHATLKWEKSQFRRM